MSVRNLFNVSNYSTDLDFKAKNITVTNELKTSSFISDSLNVNSLDCSNIDTSGISLNTILLPTVQITQSTEGGNTGTYLKIPKDNGDCRLLMSYTKSVTQLVSSTGVVYLDAPCGIINCYPTILAAGSSVSFPFYNSYIHLDKSILVSVIGHNTGGIPYAYSNANAEGIAMVTLTNLGTTAFTGTGYKLYFNVI